ncbi:hypothetical protein GCM10010430_10620 [Kitasatospora cystarginea]|uniref:Uncharacterized protein n=1 Tax=Kitasatospora cystarginea TaxID=58350 RepID=A0ABP5QFN7_9ACTN
MPRYWGDPGRSGFSPSEVTPSEVTGSGVAASEVTGSEVAASEKRSASRADPADGGAAGAAREAERVRGWIRRP